MSTIRLSFLAALLFALSTTNTQTLAQSIGVPKGVKKWGSIPITKDQIYFVVPDGFPMTASWDSNKPGLYQAGFFPDGQSKDNWKETLRLMAFQGVPKGNAAPARQMLEIVAQPAKAACPNSFFFEPTQQKESSRASAIMGCRKLAANSGMAIYGIYVVIQSQESMYVLAREFRQNSFDGDLPVPKAIQTQWQSQLDQTTVCRRNEMCVK